MVDRSERRMGAGRRALRRRARLLIAIGGTLVASAGLGCGTSGAAFVQEDPVEGQALVYIFRQSRTGGSASAFKIFANGEHVTNMSNGGYFSYAASPGDLHLKAEMKANALNWGVGLALTGKPELDVPVRAGEVYFVEFEFGGVGGPDLKLVDEQAALAQIRKCKRTKAEPGS